MFFFFPYQDGRLEAEEFTEKLYIELKSSPQPYLVPFLKVGSGLCEFDIKGIGMDREFSLRVSCLFQKSLPAVRQLTPNSQLFIQQCEQPKASSSSTINSSAPKLSLSSSITTSHPLRGSVPARPPQMVSLLGTVSAVLSSFLYKFLLLYIIYCFIC